MSALSTMEPITVQASNRWTATLVTSANSASRSYGETYLGRST
jgi:hypothetical protein